MNSSRMTTRPVLRNFILMGVVAAITVTGGMVVGNSDSQPDDDVGIQATVAALSVTRQLRSLVKTASARTHADMSAEAMAASKAAIDLEAVAIQRQLDELANAGYADGVTSMRAVLKELVLNAMQLENGRSQLAEVLRDSQNRRQQLIAETTWELLPAAVMSEDELFHRLIADSETTTREGSETNGSVSAENLLLYDRLALLKQQIDQGYIVLEVATRQTDSAFIATVEENANLVMYQLRENITFLSNIVLDDVDPKLVPLARKLLDAAYGESNLIDLMKTRLRLSEKEAQLAYRIDSLTSTLQREVHVVLQDAISAIERAGNRRETAKALEAGLAVSQHTSGAILNSSEETTVNTRISEIPAVHETVGAHISGMRQALATLEEAGLLGEFAHLHSQVDRIDSIVERIFNGRAELSEALQSAASERAQLRSFLDHQLEPAVIASLDNQLYYMLTGRSDFRAEGSVDLDRLSQTEFLRYWHLASVNESIFRTFSGLIIAIIMRDATLIGEGEERFITASHRLEKSIDFLEQEGGAEVDSQLVPLARQFIAFGNGESNVFDSLRHRLPLIATERQLIEANQQIFASMQVDIDALLDSILENATSSS